MKKIIKSILITLSLFITSCCHTPAQYNYLNNIDQIVETSEYSIILNDAFINYKDEDNCTIIIDASFHRENNVKINISYRGTYLNYSPISNNIAYDSISYTNLDENITFNTFDIFETGLNDNLNYKFYFTVPISDSLKNINVKKNEGEYNQVIYCAIDNINFLISTFQLKEISNN